MLKGKTVILVTHQVDFAKSCDHVMVLKEGQLMGSGPFEKIEDHEVPEPMVISRNASAKTGNIPPKRQKSSAVIHLHKTLRRHLSDHKATINEAVDQMNESRPKTRTHNGS